MRILIVEDEVHLSEAMAQLLKKNNYTVDSVYDGEDGLDYAMSNIYDVILLDLMLPKLDGISIARKMRNGENNTPVLMLTAKGEISDKVLGLDSGADDYLAKPFNTDELLARIRALTRRKNEVTAEIGLSFGDIILSPQTLSLKTSCKEINLTLKESEMLEYLISNKNIVLSKDTIIEKLWGFESDAEANHVEVYISFLRKKLKHIKSSVQIITIRGVGYSIKEE